MHILFSFHYMGQKIAKKNYDVQSDKTLLLLVVSHEFFLIMIRLLTRKSVVTKTQIFVAIAVLFVIVL